MNLGPSQSSSSPATSLSNAIAAPSSPTHNLASSATSGSAVEYLPAGQESGIIGVDEDRYDYELIVRQEPKQARMCGVGGKADRRPIDPPPIVQLRVIDKLRRLSPSEGDEAPSSPTQGQAYLQNPYYFMFASLAKPDDEVELHWLKDGKTRCTTGSVVSSLYHLKDPDANEDAGFFVFPDLSVRTEGSYRLKLSLFEVVGANVRHCKSIFSAPFYVYTAKKFPGMEESTPLSCSLADQGIKIRIRKDVRTRKRPIQAFEAPIAVNPALAEDEPKRKKLRTDEPLHHHQQQEMLLDLPTTSPASTGSSYHPSLPPPPPPPSQQQPLPPPLPAAVSGSHASVPQHYMPPPPPPHMGWQPYPAPPGTLAPQPPYSPGVIPPHPPTVSPAISTHMHSNRNGSEAATQPSPSHLTPAPANPTVPPGVTWPPPASLDPTLAPKIPPPAGATREVVPPEPAGAGRGGRRKKREKERERTGNDEHGIDSHREKSIGERGESVASSGGSGAATPASTAGAGGLPNSIPSVQGHRADEPQQQEYSQQQQSQQPLHVHPPPSNQHPQQQPHMPYMPYPYPYGYALPHHYSPSHAQPHWGIPATAPPDQSQHRTHSQASPATAPPPPPPPHHQQYSPYYPPPGQYGYAPPPPPSHMYSNYAPPPPQGWGVAHPSYYAPGPPPPPGFTAGHHPPVSHTYAQQPEQPRKAENPGVINVRRGSAIGGNGGQDSDASSPDRSPTNSTSGMVGFRNDSGGPPSTQTAWSYYQPPPHPLPTGPPSSSGRVDWGTPPAAAGGGIKLPPIRSDLSTEDRGVAGTNGGGRMSIGRLVGPGSSGAE